MGVGSTLIFWAGVSNVTQEPYTANRVFMVLVALYCVKRYSKKKNWILRF